MKTSDLRIGNKILGFYYDYSEEEEQEKSEICTVLALDSVGATEYTIWVEGESAIIEHYSEFKGIPLTEEILLKCGFENKHKNLFTFKDLIEIIFWNDEDVIGFNVWIYPTTPKKMENVKYLHQLQNLYFALTQNELTINL